ncbi:dnaJ homolog subfamily C member P58IPK isoform X1 [Tachypleus tridentatus]|uniref:dnaJ homolog subfamily C member P58IPK isoform X1 n=1 Tax=Tachypleus tridentatus TaxID=6853 RepID=UPI003FD508E7
MGSGKNYSPNIYRIFSSLWVFVYAADNHLTVEFFTHLGANGNTAYVENHLHLGMQLLARGQYSDALSHYHAAVEGDPSNYLTYFKRATVYLALGKSKAALEDLNKVIELKSDFLAARLQRGNILLKQGRLEEAHIDYEWVLRLDPLNEEAQRAYRDLEPVKHDLELAYILIEDRDYIAAIDVLTRLLQVCPWDGKLREMRAGCYEALNDLVNAIGDLRSATKMRSDNTEGYLKLSQLHYKLGEVDESLMVIRECLKLDPDHKQCFIHYKKVKKLAAQLRTMQDSISQNDYTSCVEKANAALKTEPEMLHIVQHIKGRMCHCLNKGGQPSEAISVCSEAVKLNAEDVNALCDRADAYILNEDYDKAKEDFQHAVNIDEHLQRAKEGLEKTQKLVKQAKKRDYYKILGVRRTAGKREIMKAYRKLAMKWHPDNFQGDEKKTAEKKFIDIAAAKEVLTDPEKRQKFDNGEDPLDPDSQQGQGFNPFAHGFNPFQGGFHQGGGPFTFKFHFN